MNLTIHYWNVNSWYDEEEYKSFKENCKTTKDGRTNSNTTRPARRMTTTIFLFKKCFRQDLNESLCTGTDILISWNPRILENGFPDFANFPEPFGRPQVFKVYS
jgi:hypothetical protein